MHWFAYAWDVTDSDVPDRIAELFGPDPVPVDAGVVHVTALARRGTKQVVTMAINEHTPKSELDTFSLNLARARADVILTTGQILRDEPALTYDLFIGEPWASALMTWRREALGRETPPEVWILTGGQGLDLDHPSFHGWARPRIVTNEHAAARLEDPAGERGIAVSGLQNLHPRGVVQSAGDLGAKTVVVEAGPRTTAVLYEGPSMIDELQLSLFEGHLDPSAHAGHPHQLADLLRDLGSGTGARRHGHWSFERWTRGGA